ncbi:MAG: AtpZ/AtpI family protein [Nitrospirae bacterium]|nr:AtpZ/AtpI family protein [Nitrospirota bacterium]
MAEKSLFKQLLEASTVGLNLVLATFIGLAMGYGLDFAMYKWFGLKTSPWFTIIFLILGIIAGFRELFRIAKKSSDGNDKKDT